MNNKQEEMEDTNMKMIKAIVRPEKSEDVLDVWKGAVSYHAHRNQA